MPQERTEQELTLIGKELIRTLGLSIKDNGRVETSIGDKTPLGLARYVESLYQK